VRQTGRSISSQFRALHGILHYANKAQPIREAPPLSDSCSGQQAKPDFKGVQRVFTQPGSKATGHVVRLTAKKLACSG